MLESTSRVRLGWEDVLATHRIIAGGHGPCIRGGFCILAESVNCGVERRMQREAATVVVVGRAQPGTCIVIDMTFATQRKGPEAGTL